MSQYIKRGRKGLISYVESSGVHFQFPPLITMEAFLLGREHHIPFLLPFLKWEDLEYLSSCCRSFALSPLRQEFLEKTVVVIPDRPADPESVCATACELSLFTRHVAISDPLCLAMLLRLPRLMSLRMVPIHGDDPNEIPEAVFLGPANVMVIRHLPALLRLDVNAHGSDLDLLLADLRRLKQLRLRLQQRAETLESLGQLRQLEVLKIDDGYMDQVDFIGSMQGLRSVRISSWRIESYWPFAQIRQVEELVLNNCNIEDLAPIATIDNLRRLSLDASPISDLTPLTRLQYLEHLSVARTRVADLRPLVWLGRSLRYLDVSFCSLMSIYDIQSLQQLRTLILFGCAWTSTEPASSLSTIFRSLTHLTRVDARIKAQAQVTDRPENRLTLHATTFSNMMALQRLELTISSHIKMDIFVQLPSLVWLRLDWTYGRVDDVPLWAVRLPRLRTLLLGRAHFDQVGNFVHSTAELQELRLLDVEIRDISPLRHLSELRTLELTCAIVYHQSHSGAPLNDLAVLMGLTKLTHLDLSYANLKGVGLLKHLPLLRYLDLSFTNTDDVSGLQSLRHLECVRLRETEISRFDGGQFSEKLRELVLPEHVDCSLIRQHAPHLKRLLHPERNCLWSGHHRNGEDRHDGYMQQSCPQS